MIDRTWCRRVGDEYDSSTMRTKTTIDRTATIMATTTPWQKQNSNWQRYRRLDDENKRPSWRQKQKDDRTKPTQAFDQTSRGQLLDDDRSKDGNKSTNKNDEGATCRRWQCLQTKMSTSRFHPDTTQSFVVALQQELLYGGTRTSSIVQKPETILPTHPKNSSKSTKSTLRVRLTPKMLVSFCTFESTKPGNKSTLFLGLRSGFCTFEVQKYNEIQFRSG